jgi:hypothetical protein
MKKPLVNKPYDAMYGNVQVSPMKWIPNLGISNMVHMQIINLQIVHEILFVTQLLHNMARTGKLVPAHTTKAYRGSRSIAPLILSCST